MSGKQQVTVSATRHFYDTDVSQVFTGSFADLCQALSAHEIVADADKMKAPMVWPWTAVDPHGGRSANNVEGTSVLFFDFDDGSGWTIADAKKVFAKYTHFGYTSHGHQKNGEDRFRIVVPLKTFADKNEVEKRRKAVYEKYNGVDTTFLSISRAFSIPACPQERRHLAETWSNEGDLFDLMAFDREPDIDFKEIDYGEISDDRKAWVVESLLKVGRVEEKDWFLCAGAMANVGYDYSVFETVTIQSLKPSKDAGDCRAKWKTAQERVATGKAPGFGYLVNFLRAHGFTYSTQPRDASGDVIREFVAKRKPEGPKDVPSIAYERELSRDELFESLFGKIDTPAVEPFSRDQRKALMVKHILGKNVRQKYTLMYAFEGFGKSYLAELLAGKGTKVLFACHSNAQAAEQAADFEKHGLRVQFIPGRDYVLKQRYQIDAVKSSGQAHPWDYERIDENGTKAVLAAKLGLDEPGVAELWDSLEPERPDFDAADIVVTTIARVQSYQRIQDKHVWRLGRKELLQDHHRVIPRNVTVFFDDPEQKFFYRYAEYSDRFKDVEIDGRKLKVKQLSVSWKKSAENGNKWFVRPKIFELGHALVDNKIVITTTELLNEGLVKLVYGADNVYVPPLMPDGKMLAGNITAIKSNVVASRRDGILLPVMKRLEKFGHAFEYIADGQGTANNLTNTKGKNTFVDVDVVVEISEPNPVAITRVLAQFEWTDADREFAKFVYAMDACHQAIGRNSGYRWSDKATGKGNRCVVIVEPRLFARLIEHTRYHIGRTITDCGAVSSLKHEFGHALVDDLAWLLAYQDRYIVKGVGKEYEAFRHDVRAVFDTLEGELKRKAYRERLSTALKTKMDSALKHGDPTSSPMITACENILREFC